MTDPPAQLPLALPAPPARPDEALVPARLVNEWVYCPRLAFLEWAHGEWADNADTAAGRRAHLKTEKGRAPPLPEPQALEDAPPLVTRRLLLASENLGLTAEIDILEAGEGTVLPVDIKAGRRPHVAEGAHMPERVQLCIQGLLLREAGYGQWLQLSLFQCRLSGGRRAEMAMRLEELIARKEDHVLILDLGPADDTAIVVESLGKSFTPIERHAIVV